MTSQNLTTNKKHVGFMPFFSFTARQFWTTTLLFTIILFFVLPVPVMMTISERGVLDEVDIERLQRMFAEDWVETIRYVVVIVISAFAIVASLSRFKYLKNKVSTDFFHSLPLKRGRLFLTQLAVSAITLVIPYVFNIIFTLIVFASNGLITEALILNLLAITVDAFIYALFFFALSTLIGMISGLSAVQLALTAVAIFIVPAIYAATVAFVGIFSENMWVDFYLSEKIFAKLSPALRFMINGEVLGIVEIALLVLFSAIMLVGAYLVYTRRKSERAGTPVVFTPLGEVIKYILVFLGTICGGLLFYALMDDFFWTVFGMICGMVLTFMLTNTILNKTARSMFKGWKGLCIFGGVTALALLMLTTNAFGINTRLPSPALTSKVVVKFDSEGGTMEFRDKDAIKALYNIYSKSQGHNRTGIVYTTTSSVYPVDKYVTTSYRVDIAFYPSVGVPVAKSKWIFNQSELMEEMRALLDSEEFGEQYANALLKLEGNGRVNLNLPYVKFDEKAGKIYDNRTGTTHYSFDDNRPLLSLSRTVGIDLIIEESKNANFDFFQQQAAGNLFVYTYGDSIDEVSVPLLTSMPQTLDFLASKGLLNHSLDELCKLIADNVDYIEIDAFGKDGVTKTVKITDKAEILEVLEASANPVGRSYSPFTFIDTRYNVRYVLTLTDAYHTQYYYDEFGNETVVIEDKENADVYDYKNEYEIVFRYGKVPDFVDKYFE